MVRPQLRNLTRDEIVWLDENCCKAHGHKYISHYHCYIKENPAPHITERVGYLDIEASNLKADFGIAYCYCIKDGKSDKILSRSIRPKEFKTCLDKEVVRQCIEDMRKFDRICTWYGSRYDIPYLRARAIYHKLDFPMPKSIWQTDLWDVCRKKLAISSNRLQNASRFILGKSDKTQIDNEYWLKALQGNQKAMAYIIDHCKWDVLDLEKVDKQIGKYAPRCKTSI